MEKIIQKNLENTQNILSCISLISSVLIIIFFIRYSNLRSLTYYFILFISFSEIIGNIPFCIKIWDNSNKFFRNNTNINMLVAFSDSFTMISLLSYSYLISVFLKNNDQKIFKTKNFFLILTFII